MAIDLGSGNTSRYYSVPDHADFSLPNGDWAWVTLIYPQDSGATKYIISTGTYGSANSFNMFQYGGAGVGIKVDALAEVNTTPSATLNTWIWLYGTRRSNNLYVGVIPVGGGTVTESSGLAVAAGYNSTTGPNIGRRSDGTADRHWKGRWGQIAFVSGAGITSAQAAELAKGAPLLSMPFAPQIKFLLHGRTASATVADLISGHVATRQSTGYGTSEEDAQTPYFWIPQYIRGVAPSGGGEVTGSVAVTNADDTSSASATVTVTASSATTNAADISGGNASPVVVANSATTNTNDVSAGNASPVVTASAANTNANDVSAASAAAGSGAEGSIAYTNIDDVSSASVKTTITASAANVNADDSSSATLKATITASVAVTNSNDISAASSGAAVECSVAVTNADDVSDASASPVISGSSATANADDISNAEAVAEAGEAIGTVDYTNIDDVSVASAGPIVTASIAYQNLHDKSAAIAVINFGTIVEAALTTGTLQAERIKKPGIPHNAPDWQRTMFEIFTGRRGNKVAVPKTQELTFSATPTKEECEALFNYTSEVRRSLEQLINRFDS